MLPDASIDTNSVSEDYCKAYNQSHCDREPTD